MDQHTRESANKVWVVSFLALVTLILPDQCPAQSGSSPVGPRGPKPDTIVRMTHYVTDGEDRVLTLRRETIQPLRGPDLERYFRANPQSTSFPNTAFLIVDSDAKDLSRGRVVWVAYVFHDRMILPQQVWSADVAKYPESSDAYAGLVKSISWHVTLAVYRFSPNVEIARYPLDLDPLKFATWPKPAEPLSVVEKTLYAHDISGIQNLRLIAQPASLLMYGEREHATMPPVWFRFDLDKKQWTQLALQKPSEPEDSNIKQP